MPCKMQKRVGYSFDSNSIVLQCLTNAPLQQGMHAIVSHRLDTRWQLIDHSHTSRLWPPWYTGSASARMAECLHLRAESSQTACSTSGPHRSSSLSRSLGLGTGTGSVCCAAVVCLGHTKLPCNDVWPMMLCTWRSTCTASQAHCLPMSQLQTRSKALQNACSRTKHAQYEYRLQHWKAPSQPANDAVEQWRKRTSSGVVSAKKRKMRGGVALNSMRPPCATLFGNCTSPSSIAAPSDHRRK